MISYQFNKAKAVNSILYILNKIGDSDYHKIFKILYFAEKEHLKQYGRPITGDDYIAMEYGPVPSSTYDLLKSMNCSNLKIQKFIVTAIQKPDLDELSESDIECLDFSIYENFDLSFNERTKKSHDSAYKSTPLNTKIDFEKIAYDAGVNDEMMKYIQFLSENQMPLIHA